MQSIESPLGPGDLVLLGAGASVEADVPATLALTERLVERIGDEGRAPLGMPTIASALHFVCGALIAHDAAEGASPYLGLDVERVFAAVELLAERRNLEVTPFVASWHPGVDAWDQQSFAPQGGFDRQFRKGVLDSRAAFDQPSRMIMQLIDERLRRSASGDTYRELAKAMVDQLRDLVATTSKSIGYLEPLVRQGKRDGGLTVATLNYDRSVELAAEEAGVELATGLETWLKRGNWRWSTSGVRLLKLHGSIDWTWKSSEYAAGELSSNTIEVASSGEEATGAPALVFGNRGKLRAEGPFLGLLAQFEKHLASASRVVVIGYSFRDDHVNELVRRWLAEKRERALLVIDPAWPEQFVHGQTDFRSELSHALLSANHADNFDDRLAVWREPCSVALQRLG